MFNSLVSPNKFVNSNFGNENKLNVYIPSYHLERTCLMGHIDTNLTEEEILNHLKIPNDANILSVKILTKTVKNNYGSKENLHFPLISIKFKGKRLLEYVHIFYNRCGVEPYMVNLILCYRCIFF
jgi:hypothetical protein